jgi:hypothetical protein
MSEDFAAVAESIPLIVRRKVGRPRNSEKDSIAAQLQVTRRTADRIKAKGLDGKDVNILHQRKLQKLEEEIKRLKIQNSILNKEYVAAAQVREDALRAGSVLKAEMMALSGTLPPLLSGLNEPQMQPVIEEIAHKALTNFCHAIERII